MAGERDLDHRGNTTQRVVHDGTYLRGDEAELRSNQRNAAAVNQDEPRLAPSPHAIR